MSRKLLAIISALLIAASLCACNNNPNEEDTTDEEINIGKDTGSEKESDTDEDETNEQGSQIEHPTTPEDEYYYVELDYTEKNETVYILHPNGAVVLHGDENTKDTNLANGEKLTRTGISADGEWSKILYEGKTYYVVTKCLTTLSNFDEGFVEVEKTLTKGDGYLNIRITPSMDNHIVGELAPGATVNVVMENTTTGWYKIKFTNYDGEVTYGYVASDAKYYVAEETDTEATEAVTETETETETETNSGTETDTSAQ